MKNGNGLPVGSGAGEGVRIGSGEIHVAGRGKAAPDTFSLKKLSSSESSRAEGGVTTSDWIRRSTGCEGLGEVTVLWAVNELNRTCRVFTFYHQESNEREAHRAGVGGGRGCILCLQSNEDSVVLSMLGDLSSAALVWQRYLATIALWGARSTTVSANCRCLREAAVYGLESL